MIIDRNLNKLRYALCLFMGNIISRILRKISYIFHLCIGGDAAYPNEKTPLISGDGCLDEENQLHRSQIADQHILPVNELASKLDEKILQEENNKKSQQRPRLKDMVHKVMEQINVENGEKIPTVNIMMSLWEQAMQKRDDFIEEDNIDSVRALKDLWETGIGSANSSIADMKDNEDILELSKLFDDDDGTYDDLLNSSYMLEQQVINELATRIEENFMLKLAKQKSDSQELEQSCEIIHDVLTKNPKSSITNKMKFKNIAANVRNQLKEVENNDKVVGKKLSILMHELTVKRDEVIEEDNIQYSTVKGLWEKGGVTGKGNRDDKLSSDDDDDPAHRMPNASNKSSSSSKRNSYDSLIRRNSLTEVVEKKKGNVNNLISIWSKNAK